MVDVALWGSSLTLQDFIPASLPAVLDVFQILLQENTPILCGPELSANVTTFSVKFSQLLIQSGVLSRAVLILLVKRPEGRFFRKFGFELLELLSSGVGLPLRLLLGIVELIQPHDIILDVRVKLVDLVLVLRRAKKVQKRIEWNNN